MDESDQPSVESDRHPPAAEEHEEDRPRNHANGAAYMHTRPLADTDAPAPDGKDYQTPLFWNRHERSISSVSYHSINQHRPAPITLEDRSDEQHEVTQACWAKSVTIDDYVIVSGATAIGSYVVWHCTVSTLKGGNLEIRKRYSDFDRLRADLIRAFPHAEGMVPQLPRKSTVSRFRPKFLEQRKAGLAHFLNCVLLNAEFAASPVLKDFIFS